MSRTSLRGALRHLAIRALLRLYPRAWRSRYGVELAALLAQRPLTPLEVVDVLRGAVDARRVASRGVPAPSAPSTSGGAAPSAGLEVGQDERERAMTRDDRRYRCSFCGKSREQVRRLIAGPNGVSICDECVSLCNQIITEEERPTACQQREGERPAAGRRAAPRWQRTLRRWLHTGRRERLRMAVRQLIAGGAPSGA
jgi:hypothetical protein